MPGKKFYEGGNMGSIETSARWQRKQARKRRAEDKRWKSLNGPVTITRIPDALDTDPQVKNSHS